MLSDVSSLANPAEAMVSELIHAFSAYFDKNLYPQATIVLLHYIRPARVKRSNIYTRVVVWDVSVYNVMNSFG